MSDIRLTSAQRILAAIRVKNPAYTFDMVDVEFGLPVVIDPLTHFSARNTELHVVAGSASTRYILEQDIYYNRNDLAIMFADVSDIGEIAEESDVAVIARINELFGMALEAADVFVVDFAEGGSFDGTSITLRAKPDSLGYIGETGFTVTVSKIPLYVAIANNVLDGLTYPAVNMVPVAPVIPNATLSSEATDPDAPGTMYAGSGNSSEGFYSTNDGELELAITARLWQSSDLQPEADGVISIALQDNQDWNIPFSVTTVGALAGTRPTDSYDVWWKVKNVDTNEEMVWELRDSVINPGNIDWVCTSHATPANSGNTITDNAHDELFSTIQNIQRVTFYPNVFVNTERLPAVPFGSLGTFEISLSARVKDALSTLQEVKMVVEVTPVNQG